NITSNVHHIRKSGLPRLTGYPLTVCGERQIKKVGRPYAFPPFFTEPYFDLEAEANFELYVTHGCGVVCGAEACVLGQLFARVDAAGRIEFGVLQRHPR